MKLFVEHLKDLREFYVNQLRMLLSAERQIAIALQTMTERSSDRDLQRMFLLHKDETEMHVQRLARILTGATGDTDLIKCKAAQGLIAECDDMYLDARNNVLRDVALLTGAERVEHFEIAAYRAVHTFANILGDSAAAELLSETLNEERAAARHLGEISTRVDRAAYRPVHETQPLPLQQK